MTADTELNICTPADGIFETHVTWADLEANLQKSLGTSAIFGSGKTVKNVGDGNGFMSKICLVEADWQNEKAGENLPKKFIAKLCTATTLVACTQKMAEKNNMLEELGTIFADILRNMEVLVKDFHNTEVNIYTLFEKYDLLDSMHAAKIYHKQKFTEEEPLKGHIIMEFMDNLESVHINNNLDHMLLHVPMRSIAKMEAASLHFTDEERSWFKTKPLQEIFGELFGEQNTKAMLQMLRQFADGKLAHLVDKIEKDQEAMLDVKRYDEIPAQLGIRPVLCHGDLWSTNILWRKSEDSMKVAAIIDFQTSHFGNPVGDMCRLFSTALSGPDRRKHWESLLETFYGFLLEELKGEEAPYTLEQLKRAYHLYYPIGAYLIVPIIGPMFEVVCNSPDAEENKRTLDIVAEKAEYLLEDLISFYEEYKNNNIK